MSGNFLSDFRRRGRALHTRPVIPNALPYDLPKWAKEGEHKFINSEPCNDRAWVHVDLLGKDVCTHKI